MICGIILALGLFGTILELLINWIESPLSCINQTMSMTTKRSLYADTLNGVPFKDETNSLGSHNSLCDDSENLIPSSYTKTSLKGIL